MSNQSEPSTLAAVKTSISQEALDQLFLRARTHSAWLPEPVPVELLRKAYELARLGPTSANGSPARFVFLTTPDAKARLKPVLAPGNVDKAMAASGSPCWTIFSTIAVARLRSALTPCPPHIARHSTSW